MKYDKAIKIIRSIYGLSQREFSQRIGISQSVVSRIESSERLPTEDFLEKVLKEFCIPQELFQFMIDGTIESLKEEQRDTLSKMLLELIILSNRNV